MNSPRQFGLPHDQFARLCKDNEARIRAALELADQRHRERELLRAEEKKTPRGFRFHILRFLTLWR